MIEWSAIFLTFKLALVVCVVLLAVGTPIATWLSFTRWRWKFLIESVVALPLVLPPTVLGFYVLVALGSNSPIGRWYRDLSGHGLPFTFAGLAIASIIYSLPFAVQLENGIALEVLGQVVYRTGKLALQGISVHRLSSP